MRRSGIGRLARGAALRALSVAALAAAAACAAPGPGRDADRIVSAALSGPGGWPKLEHLSDRVGPRLSGSPGLEAAVRWTVEEFRRDGMDAVWTEKVMVPHWERGEERGEILSPVSRKIFLTALGMSVPTPPGGVTAEVIEARSLDDLKAKGEGARGKIVFFDKRMYVNGGDTRGYGSVVGLRRDGPSAAAAAGAVGMLLRSIGTASFRLPHTGMLSYDPNHPSIPAAAISAEDADLLHRLLAAGDKVTVRFELGCRTLPDAESANVIADLRGRERPGEIVLLGAHLDSWDLGSGTIDDGAGVAIVMESMRIVRSLGLRPRRTIRAVLFVNEENGLAGGKAYAEAHKKEAADHVAAIESDSGGARPLGFSLSSGPSGARLASAIAAPLAALGAAEITTPGGGADIGPLKDLGVPTLGLRQDGTRYFDWHHTAADTLDKVAPEDLARNVAAMATMAYGLADSPEVLPRAPIEKPASKIP